MFAITSPFIKHRRDMRKHFICLANSKKYSGRCLAGIEYFPAKDGRKSQMATLENGRPQWIRPVSKTEYGSVPNVAVEHIQLLDLVAFDCESVCPEDYQSENVFYRKGSFEVVGHAPHRTDLLSRFSEQNDDCLLGDCQKAVPEEDIGQLDHSIVLIKTDTPNIHLFERRIQLRAVFRFGGTEYDLPVTDIDFHLRWMEHNDLLCHCSATFLCVSLSRPFNGAHTKLVAGVIGVG